MKVVINAGYGCPFNLSAKGVRRFAELKGRKCFFFETTATDDFVPVTEEHKTIRRPCEGGPVLPGKIPRGAAMSSRSRMVIRGGKQLKWVKRDGPAKRKAYRKQQRASRRINRRRKK